ncbi:MAG: hypothetical protein Q4E59_05950 [Bacteroidales bacterium]|nr:hypothetical protein [Bacteroidales bacterium]
MEENKALEAQLEQELDNYEGFFIEDFVDEIAATKEEREKLACYDAFAEICKRRGFDRGAFQAYRRILEGTISNDRIKAPEYKALALKAFRGVIALHSSEDEYVWESTMGVIDTYEEAFAEEE